VYYTQKQERVGRGEKAAKDMFGCMGAVEQTFSLKISVPVGNRGQSAQFKVMKVY